MSYDRLIIAPFQCARYFANKGFKNIGKNKGDCYDSDDRVFDGETGKFRRRKIEEWVSIDPDNLHIKDVRNVIMVLCGQRPVPAFRSPIYKKYSLESDTYKTIDNISKRSTFRIDSPIITGKDGKRRYINQTVTTRKCVINSWNPQQYPITLNGKESISGVRWSWLLQENFVDKETFDEFVLLLNKVLGRNIVPYHCELVPVLEEFFNKKSPDKDAFVEKIERKIGMTPFLHLLIGAPDKKHTHLNGSTLYKGEQYPSYYFASMVNKSVAQVCELCGEIFIYVYENELDLFRQGSGVASFLEGGLVRIKKIVDGNEESFDRYDLGSKPVQQ